MKNAKNIFLAIGFILIIVSGFLPFSTKIVEVNYWPGYTSVLQDGFKTPIWILFLIYSFLILFIGQKSFTNSRKFFYYFTLVLGAFLLLISSVLTILTWGATPIVPKFKYGFNFAIVGTFLIAIISVITLPKTERTRIPSKANYILVPISFTLIFLSAFLPYRITVFEHNEKGKSWEDVYIENGKADNLFFLLVTYGILIFILGFRRGQFSKIATYILTVISSINFIYLEFDFSSFESWGKEHLTFGYFVGVLGFLLLLFSAFRTLYINRNKKI